MKALAELAQLVGLDPFHYLIVTMGGILVWAWCTVVGDVALTGRGIWLRWGSLTTAAVGAALFAYTARLLK